ncbi:MAG TPA: YHS domain-containing protein [Anaerolineaceae bacterium]|nr:YHS domain-containing protein [Anaerolineaceae bacterium]
MAIDPVCGMEVDPTTAQWTSEYNGETYYFCSSGCKAEFEEDPQRYADSMGGQSRFHMGG